MRRATLVLTAAWAAVASAALYGLVFHRAGIQQHLTDAAAASAWAAAGLYLLIGSVRGFSLVPVTSLVLLGVAVFPPVPLFVLTLAGILVSSTCVYYFAGALHLDEPLRRRYPAELDRLTRALARRELPVIVAWSFLPIAPTDLICYACGVLQIRLLTCLTGVAIGEGTICAIYIAAGDALLRYWSLK
jgi:uncharacterized membrane protein YdjX (TVP38/TMEM64 family)